MKFAAVLGAFVLLIAGRATAVEVRFYPAHVLRIYEADPTHGVSSLVVHNIAVINDSAAPTTIAAVRIELLSEGRVLDARTLGSPELAAAAARGVVLQQSGQLETLRFAYGGEALLPPRTRLAATPSLAPGEALLITGQVFAFGGSRDEVRVVVNGGAEASAHIAISSAVSRTAFAFPLRGIWYDGAGPSLNSHHRWGPMEQFADDLVVIGQNNDTHRGDGTQFSDYFAYGRPIFAAAEGVVVSAANREAEDTTLLPQRGESVAAYLARLPAAQMARIARGAIGLLGNHVVIDHGDGEYSIYAHMKPGSVLVHVGQRVTQGQQIGSVGSSGNSTEPHLHFEVCDGPDLMTCDGIPPRWQNLAIGGYAATAAPQNGDFLSALPASPRH